MQIIHSKILKNFLALRHGFTTKKAGNLAFHVQDNEKNVLLNHDMLAQKLGYKKDSLIHMKQIHSNRVHIVTKEDNFYNPQECDALITNKKNTPLMVMVADCSPILFYDNINKVIAVAHAGRQGAFKNIVQNVIQSFINNFDSKPTDIHVAIGASIGPCCYEVGSEIYDEMKELKLEYAISKRDNSYYLDINMILDKQLREAGVKSQNVEFLNECTYCQNETYFSYRADKITGRFSGIVELI